MGEVEIIMHQGRRKIHSLEAVKAKIISILEDVVLHDGFGEIRIEVRILKRNQKEVIIHYGKQYRFVLDVNPKPEL